MYYSFVDEDKLILDIIQLIESSEINNSKDIIKNLGDDAGIYSINKHKHIIISVDSSIEDIHFKQAIYPPKLIGERIVIKSISDIYAMGGYPTLITIDISMNNKCKNKTLLEIYKGIIDICKKLSISIISGNISKSNSTAFSICSIGYRYINISDDIIPSKGDKIIYTGDIGISYLILYLYKNICKSKKSYYENLKKLFSIVYRGIRVPILEIYRLSDISNRLYYLTDVSDGILSELNRISKKLSIQTNIKSESIMKLINSKEYINLDIPSNTLLNLALQSDDYGYLAIIDKSSYIPLGWTVIGNISNNS